MKADLQNPKTGMHTESIGSSQLFHTLSEQAFLDTLHLASSLCNTPIAVIGLVDENCRWSVAEIGGNPDQAARILDLFHEAMLQKEMLIVGDLLKEERFSSLSDAVSDPALRFYAGVPLRNSEGHVIGNLCVMDVKPRTLRAKQKEALQMLGRRIAANTENSRSILGLKEIIASYEEEASAHMQMQERMLNQVARLVALRAVDVSILSGSDLKLTLNLVLVQVLALLHVDAATVLLLDDQTQTLECAAGRGFPDGDPVLPPIHVGEGAIGRAVLEGDPMPHWDMAVDHEVSERAEVMQREGFVDYYAVPLIARNSIKGVLEIYHRASLPITPDWIDFLVTLAGQTAIAIDNAALYQGLQHSNSELTQAYDTTIEGWSRALDLRDKETDGHSKRVTDMTLRLARKLGVSDEELVHIRRGALLHDIGKMGVPDNILLKPGPLDREEWQIMRQHPVYAYEMLSPIVFLRPALDIPYYHHEKWDGTGYPHGLKGRRIPLAARIFAVVDVWDALFSPRPYRGSWPEYKIRRHLQSLAGTHFDPAIVDAFLTLDDPEGL